MLDFNKIVFESTYNTMILVSDRNKEMVEQSTWMPEKGKKTWKDWMSAYRLACTGFKKLVEESYPKTEACIEQEGLMAVPFPEVVES